MPAAVSFISSVIGSVASAVAAAVVPIATAIASAVAPLVSAIGSILGGITSVLGTAIAPILNTVGGIANWIVTSVGQTVGGLLETVGNVTGPFLDGLGKAIDGVAKAMEGVLRPVYRTFRGITQQVGQVLDTAARPILEPIKAGLEVVYEKVQAVGDWVNTAFHPSAELAKLQTAHPELWEMSQGYVDSFIMYLQEAGIVSSTKAALLALPDVMVIISQVATVKLLADLVKGQASISDLLDKVAEGKSFETAVAIAQLSKSIVTSTVGIMDRVDTDVGILRASIDTFDEQLKASLDEQMELTRAEVLTIVTPKMTTLGSNQKMVIKGIARISRHIEDESWFVAMFLRMLR